MKVYPFPSILTRSIYDSGDDKFCREAFHRVKVPGQGFDKKLVNEELSAQSFDSLPHVTGNREEEGFTCLNSTWTFS